MPSLLYNRALLESWARASRISTKDRVPGAKLEAIGDDFDTDEYPDEVRPDGSMDDEVSGHMGNYGNIRDYEREDEMGYSEGESSADEERRQQASRLGMRVLDSEGNEVSNKSGKSALSFGAAEKASKARMKKARSDMYNRVGSIRERVLDAYRATEGLPEEVSKQMREVETASGVQDVINALELLGITARKAGAVPEGIPARAVTMEDLVGMIYLSMPDINTVDGYTQFMKVFDQASIARKCKAINENIAGKGNREEPVMPPDGKSIYNSRFVAEERGSSMKDSSVTEKGVDLGFFKKESTYAGSTYHNEKGRTVYAVPHNMFTAAKENINGGSKATKAAMQTILQSFGGSVDNLAATLLQLGVNEFRAKYGVAPPKILGVQRSCFLSVPPAPDGMFTGTKLAVERTKDMFDQILTSISGTRPSAYLVGADFTPVASITDKLSGKSSEPVEFIGKIISELSSTPKPSGGTVSFVAPCLHAILTGNYMLQKKPYRGMVDGTLTLVKPEPEPLFDYINVEGGTRSLDLAINASSSDSDQTTTMNDTLSKKSSEMDSVETGNTAVQAYDAMINENLADDKYRSFIFHLGYGRNEIPTPASSETEKYKFFSDLMSKVSSLMVSLGATSYLKRTYGNTLEPVISEADRELYGGNADIVTIWKRMCTDIKENEPEKFAMSQDEMDAINGKRMNYTLTSGFKTLMNYGKLSGIWDFFRRIMNWLSTFEGTELNAGDAVMGLMSDDPNDFYIARQAITPYIDMTNLVISVAKSGMLSGSSKGVGMSAGDAYRFLIGYVARQQREANINVLSPVMLRAAINYAMDKYGDNADILREATADAPFESDMLLEWCVMRFFMSGLDDNMSARLIPPEEVDDGPDGDEGDRIIDMPPARMSRWMAETYVKKGNPGEVVLVLLGLLSLMSKESDTVRTTGETHGAFDESDNITEGITGHVMLLQDAFQEYGMKPIIGLITGLLDGDTSMMKLARLVDDCEEGPIDLGEMCDVFDIPNIEDEKGWDELVERAGDMVGNLSSVSCIVFNGLK